MFSATVIDPEPKAKSEKGVEEAIPTEPPKRAVLARKLVVEASPETLRLVDVALVVVPLIAVKFCRVVEPRARN